MVRPMYRSRSLRRVMKRTPGGRVVIHFERDRRTVMKCGRCGRILNGVPTTNALRRKLAKTQKRPQRMFGGVLCPKCLAEILKLAVRGQLGI